MAKWTAVNYDPWAGEAVDFDPFSEERDANPPDYVMGQPRPGSTIVENPVITKQSPDYYLGRIPNSPYTNPTMYRDPSDPDRGGQWGNRLPPRNPIQEEGPNQGYMWPPNAGQPPVNRDVPVRGYGARSGDPVVPVSPFDVDEARARSGLAPVAPAGDVMISPSGRAVYPQARPGFGGGAKISYEQPVSVNPFGKVTARGGEVDAPLANVRGLGDLSRATGMTPWYEQDPIDIASGFAGGAIRGVKRLSNSGAPFPEYAEVYPPTGPPELKYDKKKKQEYLAKKLMPEAEAFAKERQKIQKDMEKNGFEPYFNADDRYYVDPANYPPPNVDTTTIVPKTQKSMDKYMEAIGAPETAKALRMAYGRGIELGNADHWYAMGQLEKKYIDELGIKVGREKFLDEFAAPVAATTSGNDPTANLLMGHYMEYLRKGGKPLPDFGYDMPYPVGGRRPAMNLRDYDKMREGGGYQALGENQPKMHNFARSFVGDLSHPVMDEQMAEGMLSHAPGLADPARKTAYGLLEGPVREEAARLGVQPGNVQDVAWAGFKDEPGKPMIQIVNEAIERTARLTGMSRDEIVRRGLVRKEIPLYSGFSALLGGAAAGGDGT